MLRRLGRWLRRFFLPPAEASLTVRILPYAVLGALTLVVLVSGAYAWDYTNSPQFCGTVCHTMPPEYTAYLTSPHASGCRAPVPGAGCRRRSSWSGKC